MKTCESIVGMSNDLFKRVKLLSEIERRAVGLNMARQPHSLVHQSPGGELAVVSVGVIVCVMCIPRR